MGREQRRKKPKRQERHRQEEQQQNHQIQQRLQQLKQEARKQEQRLKQQQNQQQGKKKRWSSRSRPQFNPKNRPDWFFRHLDILEYQSADHERRVFGEDLSDIEPSKKDCTHEEDGSECECEIPVLREYTGDDKEEELFRKARWQREMYKRENKERFRKIKSAVETLLRNESREERKPLYYMSRNITSKFDLVSEEYTAPVDPDGIRTSCTIDFSDMGSFRAMKVPSLRGLTELKVGRQLTGCLSIDGAEDSDDEIRVEFESFECPQTPGVY
ncbi:hypothetical protein CORC01_11397 [Colletotrichum orchidophilum]|uniref:Uncharacterized protein n=1 Tax=Colletotrichum orchidophilum TaxID=1209926 RepID=A0A1G4AVZ1_9PEZI|nr:uncharacterized protein CORC01_11397 [Colletotrichum orchidophilum]OHE93329.1 hypothetical protein CORC01_11397 [Colletotrichum orchidophilum]